MGSVWPRWVAVAVWAVAALRAGAIVVDATGQATIRWSPAMAPSQVSTQSFTIVAWIRREARDEVSRGVFQLPGTFQLGVDGSQGVRFTVHPGGAAPLSALAAVDLPVGEWALIVATWDMAAGRANVRVRSQSMSFVAVGGASSGQAAGRALSPPGDELAIGAHPRGWTGFIGALGPIAVRSELLAPADFTELWRARSIFGVYEQDNRSAGGVMAGAGGCAWMTNHAISTLPLDHDVGRPMVDLAAWVGGPVTRYNVHVYDARVNTGWAYHERLQTVHATTESSGFTYASHRDPPRDGFFEIPIPHTRVPPTPAEAIALKARQLVDGPTQPLRVVISGHSRAVKRFDGSGRSPGNYAHGFIDLMRPQVCGTMFRPAVIYSEPLGAWFGLDGAEESPRFDGLVQPLDGSTAARADFTRVFTLGSVGSRGPGTGMWISTGSSLAMRCKSEEGSLMTSEHPLRFEALVVRHPGASRLSWEVDVGPSQADPGRQAPGGEVVLDTTRYSRTLTGQEGMETPTRLMLLGDATSNILVGQMCFVAFEPGAGSASVVTGVSFDGERTVISLEHPFGDPPGEGSVLKFGPWGIEVIGHDFAGIAPGDPDTWRGLRLRAAVDDLGGAVILAWNAWRPDVNGYIFIPAGAGARAYDQQMSEAFRASTDQWMAMTRADVWIIATTQSGSVFGAMHEYTDRVMAACPGVDVVWASDVAHGGGLSALVHEYTVAGASQRGLVGISAIEHPLAGSYLDQLADGMRSNGSHFSGRGNVTIAKAWVDLLDWAALTPCMQIDFNRDSELDIFDLLFLQSMIAQLDLRADLNQDGALDVFDLLEFLNRFSACP